VGLGGVDVAGARGEPAAAVVWSGDLLAFLKSLKTVYQPSRRRRSSPRAPADIDPAQAHATGWFFHPDSFNPIVPASPAGLRWRARQA